jgi:hypothetical protein
MSVKNTIEYLERMPQCSWSIIRLRTAARSSANEAMSQSDVGPSLCGINTSGHPAPILSLTRSQVEQNSASGNDSSQSASMQPLQLKQTAYLPVAMRFNALST